MTTEALDLALAMFREPARIAELRERGLPSDLGQVIRIAAGEGAAVAAAVERCDEPEDTLKEASVFFLQQVLFAPGADSYRTLGVDADAPQEALREHYRWLMKWLHPDRNQDGWEAVYADRVNAAWQDLKTPDRRAEYDRKLPSFTPLVPVSAPPVRMRAAGAVPSGPILSGSTVRRLPAIILGGLGLTAALVLGLMYWAQKSTERELAARMADGTAASEVQAEPPSVSIAVVPDPPPSIEQASGPEEIQPSASAPVLSPPAINEPADVSEARLDVASAAVALTPSTPDRALPETPAASVPQPQEPSSLTLATATTSTSPAAAVSVPVAVVAVPAGVPPVVSKPRIVTEPEDLTEPAPRTASVTAQAIGVSGDQRPEASVPVAAATEPTPPVASPTEPAMAAAAPAPEAVAPPPVPAAPTTQDSAALVADLKAAYASGNAARFEALFANGTVPADLRAIRARLDSAQMRYMEFGDLRWDEQPGYRRAWVSYRETYVLRGEKRGQTESGLLELHLALVDGRTQIARARRQGGS